MFSNTSRRLLSRPASSTICKQSFPSSSVYNYIFASYFQEGGLFTSRQCSFHTNFGPLFAEEQETSSDSSVKTPLYDTNVDVEDEDYSHLTPKSMDYTSFFAPEFKRPSIRVRKLKEREQFIREENLDITDMSLNSLKRVPYSRKVKIRVGRGQGGRRGKYSGRGLNGQKSRAGRHIPLLFEGGQLKLSRRAPKYGFSNKKFELKYEKVSLERLQFFIDTGRIDPTKGRITMKTLLDSGLVRKVSYPGLKLVANGGPNALRTPINIEIPKASLKSIAAIEAAGGSITTVYYDRNSILAMIRGEEKYLQKHYNLPKRAIPPPKLYRYYMRKDVRGYLSDESLMVEERSAPVEQKAETKKALQQKLKQLVELRRKKAKVKKF